MGLMKQLAQTLAAVRAWPVLWRYRLSCQVMGQQRAMTSLSESIARRPGMMGNYVRQAVYGRVLSRVGRDVTFGFMSLLSKPQASIGNRVYIGRFCTLGWVTLEDDVMLADAVQILSGARQHGSEAGEGQTLHDNEQQFSLVTIGKGAWIGANAVVMADVGAGAIVGAGAVVTKPVAPGTRVGGVPAKVLGSAVTQSTTQTQSSADAVNHSPSTQADIQEVQERVSTT